jgi:hypothetical protein
LPIVVLATQISLQSFRWWSVHALNQKTIFHPPFASKIRWG